MTCVVGLVDKGTVWMGGDSSATSGWQMVVRSDPKVFRNGPYVMGFTTSYRMGQLLQWSLVVGPPPEGDVFKFMATTFVDAIRGCLAKGGFAKKENGQEEGGLFLVGIAGRLFRIDSDYQVGESAHGYDAVGCGAETALGALYGSRRRSPEARVGMALSAAEYHSAGVRGPFTVLHG